MKFLVRWLFRLLILLIVLVVALVLMKDVLLKALAEHQIRRQTGLHAKIGKLEAGLFSPTLTVEDLKLYNTAEFGGAPFLDMPDLHVEYSPGALARYRMYLPLVRVALAEVNIVETRDGRTNLVSTLENLKTAVAPVARWGDSLLTPRFSGIGILNLTLGKIRYTSLKQPAHVTEVNLDLRNELLTDLKSFADVTNQVMKTLFRNGITISSDAPAERKVNRPRPNLNRSRE